MKPGLESSSFHAFQDNELRTLSQAPGQRLAGQYVYIQTRNLSYRFYLHQHPYAQQLVQRLLKNGVRGLQDADTDYTNDGTALAGSVQVWLDAGTVLNLPNQIQIVLLKDITVSGQVLKAGLRLNCGAEVAGGARFEHGIYATLVAAKAQCPEVGSVFALASGSALTLDFDTRVILTQSTAVLPGIGSSLNLPATTEVLLARGSTLVSSASLNATLRKRRLKPTLYDDFFGKDYQPESELVQAPYPVKDLDFTSSGA